MHKTLLLCLVVEDEPLAQQVLENYIQRIEELHLVAKCETVEDALVVLQSEKIDVVFLDLQLQTTAGTEIIAKMKRTVGKRFYIVITSARLEETLDAKKVFNQDHIMLIDYLTKPFSFNRFHRAIDKILNENASKK